MECCENAFNVQVLCDSREERNNINVAATELYTHSFDQ